MEWVYYVFVFVSGCVIGAVLLILLLSDLFNQGSWRR